MSQTDELIGIGEDGQIEWSSSIADFLAANDEDEETCDAVRALEPGDEVVLGGGAASEITIRRRIGGLAFGDDACPVHGAALLNGECLTCEDLAWKVTG